MLLAELDDVAAMRVTQGRVNGEWEQTAGFQIPQVPDSRGDLLRDSRMPGNRDNGEMQTASGLEEQLGCFVPIKENTEVFAVELSWGAHAGSSS
jgi:hypothetical protein